MLKHQKNKTHRFGTVKPINRVIADLINCKKCHKVNAEHQCETSVVTETENNTNVIYKDA